MAWAWWPVVTLSVMASAAFAQAPPAVQPPAAQAPAVTTPVRFVPRIATQAATDARGRAYAILTINETPAASIHTSAGGYTPPQRAAVAAERLLSLLQGGLVPQELAAQADAKPQWEVAARGGPLLMATPQEAAAHGMTPKALAQSWVRTMRLLLAEPPLTLSASSLVVPLGETRTVRVGGAVLPQDVRVQDDSGAVGAALYDPARRTLTVSGRATGRDVVAVSPAPGVGGAPLTLPVTVLPYAGRVAPAVSVEVTGDPAPPRVVEQAAYLGLTHALSLEDGAQVSLGALPILKSPLALGAQTAATFPLRLSGSGLLPVTGSAVVTVVNGSVPPLAPSLLFYSNNPEQVRRVQTLFSGDIAGQESVRLDFHHQNMSGELLGFHVDLWNDGDAPASVQVIAGLALPGGDTVQVGRRAGAAFLQNLNGNIGLVLTVPPHGGLPLVTQRFAPGLTLSGLMQIQGLSDVPLRLTVRSTADTDALTAPLWRVYMAGDGGSALAAPSAEAAPPPMSPTTSEIFVAPHLTPTGRYTVDGRWAFIPLGDKDALHDHDGGSRLFGNYGADYDIGMTLVNPTAAPRTVGLFFAPGAGPAAAIFQVDNGPIQEYDPLVPPDERQLAQETLAAGETRVVHLRTILLNGSAYPAQIVAHVLDQAPVPPVPPPAAAVAAAGKTVP